MQKRSDRLLAVTFLCLLVVGCNAVEKLTGESASKPNSNSNANKAAVANSNVDVDDTAADTAGDGDDVVPSGSGVEKEKPAAGKANVQGKAFFNEKPAAGVDVKLCKTFNQYFGGCGGETFTGKTDDNGEYLIKNVPPGTYEGLTVRVFNTPYYVFATSGIIAAAKYELASDKTYFAPDTHLFKNDLKLLSPRAGAKVAADGIEVKWDAYPDAAYYKLSIHADSASGGETVYDFINKRVDDTSFTLDKALKAGSYSVKVDAYNANDRKLAQSAGDIKFSVR